MTQEQIDELALSKFPVQMDSITTTDGNRIEYDYNEELREALKAGYAAAPAYENLDELKLQISKILVRNKYKLPVTNADTAVYVVDIPKVSQILADLFAAAPAYKGDENKSS